MRPSFHPRLVNGPFEDPCLFVPFLYQRRALLIDLGNIQTLSSRDLLKISHVFITHTHMDHFIGFDPLLRIFLGREKILHLFGPHGFLSHLKGKLSAYSWDLVQNYPNQFDIYATEIRPDVTMTCRYRCQDGFKPQQVDTEPSKRIIYREPEFIIETAILDHGIECLGFSVTERFHINIIKQALNDMGLKTGSWLKTFKDALFQKVDPKSRFEIELKDTSQTYILGDLTDRIARITPGQKITYISDISYHPLNKEKAVSLARGSDQLFIEAPFLDSDKKTAQKKHHLTARQAGEIAARAGVKQLNVFHFSPRYSGSAHLLQTEALDSYHGIGERILNRG